MATSTRNGRRLAPATVRPDPVEPAARPPEPPSSDPTPRTAAATAAPLVQALLGDDPPIRIALWDGSALGDARLGTVHVRRPAALRRILYAPGELGLARAYVSGDLDIEGDIVPMLEVLSRTVPRDARIGLSGLARAARAALGAGAVGRPLPAPPEECRSTRGRRLHSKARDARAVSHHYDVGNDFYDIVLGPAMTYSCAYYDREDCSLADAQAAKHELVCRKLGLHEQPGARLLDVGCGWGSLAMHAAAHHGATAVGITISREQAERARARVAEAGLADRVEIRLQDYRDLGGETFDAISSIGMFEHVGKARMAEYFTTLHGLLRPGGRLLNHAISSVGGSRIHPRSFIGRYVFPDGELIDVGDAVLAMEAAGFEVRDVHSLREHYARTLRAWVANLEADWERAVALTSEGRARVWRLYMAASAVGFDDGGISIHQVLGVVPHPTGASGMPPTRDGWSTR